MVPKIPQGQCLSFVSDPCRECKGELHNLTSSLLCNATSLVDFLLAHLYKIQRSLTGA